MNNKLQFDFTVDKASKKVFITREFDADQSLVWDAFTRAEILDQWAAPAPFAARTKYQDFKVGGKRFYAMVSPDGQERWIMQTYKSITPKSNFRLYNAFSDKDENAESTGSEWDYSFSCQNKITKVSIAIYNESLERLERMLELGFQGGFTVSLQQLDVLMLMMKNK